MSLWTRRSPCRVFPRNGLGLPSTHVATRSRRAQTEARSSPIERHGLIIVLAEASSGMGVGMLYSIATAAVGVNVDHPVALTCVTRALRDAAQWGANAASCGLRLTGGVRRGESRSASAALSRAVRARSTWEP